MVKNTDAHSFDIQIIHGQYKLKLFNDFIRFLSHGNFCFVFTFKFFSNLNLNISCRELETNLNANISMYK